METRQDVRQRTLSREVALKALYQHDLRGEFPPGGLEALCEAEGLPPASEFARELVDGCITKRVEIDRIIEQTAENWRLDRMPFVDRNILRLGTYELVFREDTPPKVVINEAIEMAKKYSTENSATFVNGVLDRLPVLTIPLWWFTRVLVCSMTGTPCLSERANACFVIL